MFAKLYSAGLVGMDAFIVECECAHQKGLPAFEIVGLPDNAVKESRDRVRAAIKNCGFEFPLSKITVNLAPADTKKYGPYFDLPLFLCMLACSDQVRFKREKRLFIGELSLMGLLRPAKGILPMVLHAKEMGFSEVYIPFDNAAEASVVRGIDVYAVKSVLELILHLKDEQKIKPLVAGDFKQEIAEDIFDFCDVAGQKRARRALEIAAAGGHNILLIGPPGAGKSMLAKRLPSILPQMTFDQSIETTKIHSVAGTLPSKTALLSTPPYRTPHHTVSPVGLSGGGVMPMPGEISLAHNGVLFLDELPEFPRRSMEILRQPLEDGQIIISRSAGTATYPCRVMFVAAMNPCPCGYFGHPTRRCICTGNTVARYLNKVSGPLLDRLDLHVEVPPVDYESLSSKGKSESSADIRERVMKTRDVQIERYKNDGINFNAQLHTALLKKYCELDDVCTMMMERVFENMSMSARAYDRILKVSRTIADLDGCERIGVEHLSEAVQYRSLDRKYWA